MLEIGTFVGCSAAYIAQHLPDDGNIITIDQDEKAVDLARRNFLTLDKKDSKQDHN